MKSEPIVKRNVVQVVRCEVGPFTPEELPAVQHALFQRERTNRRVFNPIGREEEGKVWLGFHVLHANLRSTAPKDIREMVASACGWAYEDTRIVIESVAALTDLGSATPHFKSSRAGTKRKVTNKRGTLTTMPERSTSPAQTSTSDDEAEEIDGPNDDLPKGA